MHIAPLVQNNSILKKDQKIGLTIRDLRILRNEKWGSKIGVTLLEIVFESTCGRIIVKRLQYSFDYRSDISSMYRAVTGNEIDEEKGFDSSEIIGKSIIGTVSKYESKGYSGTTVKDFEAVK